LAPFFMRTKETIRTQIATQRKALNADWIDQASKKIVTQIQNSDWFKNASTIALYYPLLGEVDLTDLFQISWRQKKETAVPVFQPTTQQYAFAKVTSTTQQHSGRFKINEPINPLLVSLKPNDLMLVPGVAFDPFVGDRLGRGGGYYDRLLCSFSGHALGVGFCFQLVHPIPTEATDQPIHGLVTEEQLLFF